MSLKSEEHSTLVYSEIFPPAIGGSGKWLHDIYSRQTDGKYIFLVGSHPDAEGYDADSILKIVRFGSEDLIRTLMSFEGVAYFVKQIVLMLRLHNKYKFKEIHCARALPEGVAALLVAKLYKLSLVCYIHGEDIEISRFSKEYRFLTQKVVSRADRLVCNSDSSKSLLLDYWKCDESKVRILNPGVDTALFHPTDDIAKLKEKLGWTDRKVILTVSRLDERKGHDKMIEALPAILKQVPNCLYVIIGGGLDRQKEAIKRKISELQLEDNIKIMGKCDMGTMIECYQACDLFVLPNRKIGGNLEGFGIVLLEAQSCAKAVIAGNSGGTIETMEPNETGLIVDCTKSENLVEPVLKLLQNEELALEMGKKARELMLHRFSWSKIVERATDAIAI